MNVIEWYNLLNGLIYKADKTIFCYDSRIIFNLLVQF